MNLPAKYNKTRGDLDLRADAPRLAAAVMDLRETVRALCIQMNNLLMVAEVPDRFAESFNKGQSKAKAILDQTKEWTA